MNFPITKRYCLAVEECAEQGKHRPQQQEAVQATHAMPEMTTKGVDSSQRGQTDNQKTKKLFEKRQNAQKFQ